MQIDIAFITLGVCQSCKLFSVSTHFQHLRRFGDKTVTDEYSLL